MARSRSGHSSQHADKAARKVEQVTDKIGAKLDKAQADIANKAAKLDQLASRLGSYDVWTRPEPGSRRTKFTRDEIAAAALRIADEEGIDALSMRRLAADLGAGTMTLYHYVHTKDELLAIVHDTVMGELIVPDDELPTDWRGALTMIALRSRDVIQRHPWSLDIPDDPAPGPNGARHFDQTMQAVLPLRLPLGDLFELVTAVDEYVFGYCLVERTNDLDIHVGANDAITSYLRDLVQSGDYPALTTIEREYGFDGAFAAIAEQARDPHRFERNLNRLLDGFAAEFDRR